MVKLQVKTSTDKFNKLFYIFGIISILFIWFILSKIENNFIVPKITDVIKDTFEVLFTGKYILLILKTIFKLFCVVTVTFVISFILSVLSYNYKKFRAYIFPFITFIRTIPVASFVVILLILIGSNKTPIVITSFVLIPIMYETLYVNFKDINNDIVEETKLISKINLNIFIKVFVPIVIKQIISLLLSSFGLGLKVLIMSEVITQGSNTIGGIIANEKGAYYNMTRVFSWTLILILIVMIIEGCIKIIEKKINKI